ncbi:glycopeptide resistance accessory protein VanW [Natronincola ferrireducens]|uniref:Vancomycin resistance protein VanW n=1 Tax=Natronincola ferrireducens TaxID=393762 RepID=A0A1G8Z3T6_9FIRM|nr:glycopeptide resistance accessory protein VanW [Natronincola ferrireducens]SDK09738.1 vancomycin resistance protein VanW [Natronincola ferrireducens]
MQKKRVTERFPFLLPIRKFQRKIFFYAQMKTDSNKYARKISKDLLEHKVFLGKSKLINSESGYDIKYQINKIHNLKLVANTMNKVIIEPNETFSFWMLAKDAESGEKYKKALVMVNNQIVPLEGGGLCQMSNLLFWLFIHTPLTIVERHPHSAETMPLPKGDIPEGVDATIAEGWLDLKVKNETQESFQLFIEFDDEFMYGTILSNSFQEVIYTVKSENVKYTRENEKIYRYNQIYKEGYSFFKKNLVSRELILDNKYEIKYDIESEIGVIK